MSNDEWGTPDWLYDELNREFSFNCDVCASKSNFKHPNFYSKELSGLDRSNFWGTSNWCNPPYSNTLPWLERAEEESDRGNNTVILMMADCSTKAFAFAASRAQEIRLINQRIKFDGAVGSPRFSSMLVIFYAFGVKWNRQPYNEGAAIRLIRYEPKLVGRKHGRETAKKNG